MLGEASCKIGGLSRRIIVQSFIIGVPCSVWGSTRAAQDIELRVLIAGDIESVRPVVEVLQKRRKKVYYSTRLTELISRPGGAVYVAIGPAALAAVLEANLQAPVISIFTSSQTYSQLIEGRGVDKLRRVTGIFAECSPDAQMQVASALFQRRISVAVLLSSATTHLAETLRRAASKNNIDLLVHLVPPGANPVRELTNLTAAAVILAIPDGTIFNSQTLRGLLESTYRRGQAIVGFSTSLVSAGTLATAYTTVDDVVAQVDEVFQGIAQGTVPEPQYPHYWHVEVNRQVARSLNIVVSDRVLELGSRPKAR
jgi:ABC-type uncharacterized transport system substrate-binding protein